MANSFHELFFPEIYNKQYLKVRQNQKFLPKRGKANLRILGEAASGALPAHSPPEPRTLWIASMPAFSTSAPKN